MAKGKQGHRPDLSNQKRHNQEGVANKTEYKKGMKVSNKHLTGTTASSVGRFGNLYLHNGEGKADKRSNSHKSGMAY